MRPLEELARAEKAIAQNPLWGHENKETGYSRFLVPLEIGGVVEKGLFLRGGTYIQHPEQHVTLEVFYKGSQKNEIGLDRTCWKTLDGGHTNRRRPGLPAEISGKRIKGSHFHDFELNWFEQEKRMRGKGELPFARGFPEEFHTFESMLESCGKLLKINNINLVLKPEWAYNLFDEQR